MHSRELIIVKLKKSGGGTATNKEDGRESAEGTEKERGTSDR